MERDQDSLGNDKPNAERAGKPVAPPLPLKSPSFDSDFRWPGPEDGFATD
jgi:hypothetical protein